MKETIIQLQVLVGAIFALALIGWSLYRLSILFGWKKPKKKAKSTNRPIPEKPSSRVPTGKKRNIVPSKKDLYTGKRIYNTKRLGD